jgi:hypothetical protein
VGVDVSVDVDGDGDGLSDPLHAASAISAIARLTGMP